MCSGVVTHGVGDPSSSGFLLVVLELLAQALLSQRDLCADLPPGQVLGREALQAWRAGLQAQAGTRGGQAVARVLAVLSSCP
jgi:hypothetical protein